MNTADTEQSLELLRLQSLALASSANSIAITDRDGRIIWANKAFAELTGYPIAEAVGQTMRLIKSGHQDDSFYKRIWATILAGRVWHGELINKRKDNTFYYEDMTITPVCNEMGKIHHFIAIKQDITDSKQLQQQIIQTQKMESIGRLAGGIAHDFNNILQIITGFSDILMSTMEANNPCRADVNEIQKAATQAVALTRQLLDFSRKQVIKLEPIDLNEVVHHMQSMLGRVLGENIDLVTVLDPNLSLVNADVGLIESIITNLAINGRDAMPEGGRLTISTTNVTVAKHDAIMMPEAIPGAFVCLAVSDSGIGMDRETMQHLFEPFYSTKGAGIGTGLGLATVYGVAKQHNGWINVYSQVGQGSTFKFYLPISTGLREDEQAVDQSFVLKSPKGHGQRILLVEDELSVQKLVTMVLRANGYQVIVATTATEATELFDKEQGGFDLIFSDVVLPDRDGLRLVEGFLVQKPELRVLMTSGYSDQKSRWPSIHERGWPFLQKPYPISTLLQAVAGAIQPDPPG